MEKRNRYSIKFKIICIVLIPIFAYFLMALSRINMSVNELQDESAMRKNLLAITVVSEAIKNLQIERGKSAVYVKSNGAVPFSYVKEQRNIADGKLSKVLKEIKKTTVGEQEAVKSISKLSKFRKMVENKEAPSKFIAGYTSIIEDLQVFISRTDERASAKVVSLVQSLVRLEKAREAAGLYRANTSSIFSSNTPIDIPTIKKVNKLSATIDSNLALSFLDVPDQSRRQILSLSTNPQWKKKDRFLDSVIAHSREGDYGFDGKKTFSTLTMVVDDVGNLISRQLKSIDMQLFNEKTTAQTTLVSRVIEAIMLLTALCIMLIVFIRKFNSSIRLVIELLQQSNMSLEKSSNNIAVSGETLDSSSTLASSAIQETVSSITQIKQTMEASDEQVKTTAELSKDVSNRVVEGEQRLKGLLTSMNSISDSTQDLDEIIESIRSIKEKTSVINDIVFQTQLLSFNASIEAVKAGAHGKGFSVVAEEVGKLAVMSGEAAAEITELLDASSASISKSIDLNRDLISRGIKDSEDVAKVFTGISKNIFEIDSKTKGIMDAFNEHNQGINQVNSAMEKIDNSIQQNVSCSKDALSQSRKLSDDSHGLTNVIEKLLVLIYGDESKEYIYFTEAMRDKYLEEAA